MGGAGGVLPLDPLQSQQLEHGLSLHLSQRQSLSKLEQQSLSTWYHQVPASTEPKHTKHAK